MELLIERLLELDAQAGKALVVAVRDVLEEMRDDGSRQHGGGLVLGVVAQEQTGEPAVLDHGQGEAVRLRANDADGFISKKKAGIQEVAGGAHLINLKRRRNEVADAAELP